MSETVECDECGGRRYTWEACSECGHKPWADGESISGGTAVLECPLCGDRKLINYTQQLVPTVWCNCDDFALMNTIHKHD